MILIQRIHSRNFCIEHRNVQVVAVLRRNTLKIPLSCPDFLLPHYTPVAIVEFTFSDFFPGRISSEEQSAVRERQRGFLVCDQGGAGEERGVVGDDTMKGADNKPKPWNSKARFSQESECSGRVKHLRPRAATESEIISDSHDYLRCNCFILRTFYR